MRAAIMFATVVSIAVPAAAEPVFRCAAPGGSVSYQQFPCDEGAEGRTIAIPANFPDHVAPRERLAAREAAADARILRRLEIESAERIARDERAARENAYLAERERTAAAESAWGPVWVASPAFDRRFDRRVVRHQPRVTPHSLPLMR